MTDKAVSALTSLTGANTATGDLIYIVDISEASAADRSKKITAQELQNYMKKFPATIGVGGATPAASGAGISFPATVSASSDANTLDDYEEGTSTGITIAGATTAGTQSGTISATYTKVGNFIYMRLRLEGINLTGASGVIAIGDLPFSFTEIDGIVSYIEGITPSYSYSVPHNSSLGARKAGATSVYLNPGVTTTWDNYLTTSTTWTGGGGSTYGNILLFGYI